MEQSAKAALQTPVQFIKGVGPDRAQVLERLGLRSVRDLLFFFPRDYVDLSERRAVPELEAGVAASVSAEVEELEQRVGANGRTVLSVLLRQEEFFCRAVWFNQPFMLQRFRRGQRVLLSGTPKLNGLRWEFIHPRVTFFDSDQDQPGEILPVYPLTEGLKQHHLRKILHATLAQYLNFVPEVLPDDFRAVHQLSAIQDTLRQVHQPTDSEALDQARYRLVYQELLVMQLALALRKQQLAHRQGAISMPCDARIDARIRRLFPFDLTDDQTTALHEVKRDMAQTVPMNRLLQGDVGSGKTAVAAYAMLLCVAHDAQAVLMAPTEVLARQHYQTLSSLLEHSEVRLKYLAGSSTTKQRREIVQDLADGKTQLLVGTHAVVSQDLKFQRLGLVIVDEQHKFGVIQRALLRQGEHDPHSLVMTATPIPRTIAMTAFGDLDVSILASSPPGRQPVHSYWATEGKRAQWWDFFRKKLRSGQQGFVISPVVDQGDDETMSAEAALENLANGELAEFRLDLLHGRMKSDEKLQVMQKFSAGETQVLISTSVVEVGIDVPNANLMTIEHGDRFGLSQLHQLRGRVGRGVFPGYVCVFADATTDESQRRMNAFVETNDGFKLAELDFEIRGPGEVFGTRQHGLPPLMVADLRRDAKILAAARRDAQSLVERDPALRDPAWQRLRRMVLVRYGRSLQLANIG